MLKKLGSSILLFLAVASINGIHISADPLATPSLRLDRLNESTGASHTFFYVSTNTIDATEELVITYPTGIFAFGGSYDFNEMQLSLGSTSNCATATFTNKTLAATPSGTTWGATYASDVVTFTSGTDVLLSGRCIRVTLANNGGANGLVNPAVTSNTSYTVLIESGSPINNSSVATVILNDTTTPDTDEIQINANISDSLSFDVDVALSNCNNSTETTFSTNRINFGTLAPGIVKSSNGTYQFICVDFATNALNGASIYIQSARANAIGGLTTTSGGVIPSASVNLNLGGNAQGYGVRVASLGTPATGSFSAVAPFNSGTAGFVGQLTGTLGSPSSIVSATAPVATGVTSRIAIEVSAKASVGTGAGVYSDTLTLTAIPSY